MALIMIADDAPALIAIFKEMLAARGHQVVAVSDGIQMVEKAKSWRPHLIISDIMMPGAYGSAAYKSLLEDEATAKIPVIFITAASPEQVRKIVPQAPNIRLLLKPVDSQLLLKTIEELLPPAPAA